MKQYMRSRQRKIKNLVHDPRIIDELWDDMASKWANRASQIDIIGSTLLLTSKKRVI